MDAKQQAQEATLIMDEATKAFKEHKRTADVLIEHGKTCKVCRSRVRSFFYTCLTRQTLAFEHLVAVTDAEEYFARLKNLKLELEIATSPDAVPSLAWLDGLYNL